MKLSRGMNGLSNIQRTTFRLDTKELGGKIKPNSVYNFAEYSSWRPYLSRHTIDSEAIYSRLACQSAKWTRSIDFSLYSTTIPFLEKSVKFPRMVSKVMPWKRTFLRRLFLSMPQNNVSLESQSYCLTFLFKRYNLRNVQCQQQKLHRKYDYL